MENNQALAEMMAELNRLKAENEQLRNQPKAVVGGLTVTPKGAVRVPGIGMFGLCLYREQWNRLFTFLEAPMPEKLAKFIQANEPRLSVKDPNHKSIFADEFKRRAEEKRAAQSK